MQFYDHLGIVTIFIIVRFSARDVLISGMRSRRQKRVWYMGACGQHHLYFSLTSEIWERKTPTSLQFLKIRFLLNQFPITSSQLVNPSQHEQSIKERQYQAMLHLFNKNGKTL